MNETGRIDDNTNNTPGRIFQTLRTNADFRLRFADRVHRHLFNGGALTVAENQARMEAIRSLLRSAMNAGIGALGRHAGRTANEYHRSLGSGGR